MKKKLIKVLTDKCKDFGLTEKAINDIAELKAADLKDDATDEDINAVADSLVPYAKAMQGEITRKTQKRQSTDDQSKKDGDKGEGDNKNNGADDNATPAWAKAFQERLDKLENENATLKKEKAETERATTIADKAKKLGIPEFLVKKMTFAEDADIDKELADLKQNLVNENLVPKGQSQETSTSTKQMTDEEDAWAKSLPGK
jgi:hypothetical protein